MSTILVIDDEANIRLMYEGMLKDEGYDVMATDTGTEGLQVLREQPVDLVVLDIKLKTENGLDVLQRIVRQHPDVPVVLCSAYISFQDDYTSWLAERYVVKSGDPTELLQEVKRVLAQRSQMASA
jgi:DNA-binding NtrC family response regulator